MTLSPEQQCALSAFENFLDDPNQTLFALLGWAGCGKSYTAAHMFEMIDERRSNFSEMLWLAPTWKATHVAGRFLASQGVSFETRYDRFKHQTGKLILTTTQQALGIAPIIDDDQSEDKQKFAQIFKGTIEELRPRYIVIDEVSMLSRNSLKQLYGAAQRYGIKVLIIGDPGQLPPVGEKEINWDGIKQRYQLQTIMRQSGDSAIPVIAEAIRKDEHWRDIGGVGVEHVHNVKEAFLESVGVPSKNEEERDVFIAYRNVVVNEVQEAACRKVYGHGRNHVEVGQTVIAQSPISKLTFNQDYGLIEDRICNQDEITVTEKHGQGEWGEAVTVETRDGKVFNVEYLTQEAILNPKHPYRVELGLRASRARDLQAEFKTKKWVDAERKAAWKSFFDLKDNTVLSFAHPFALTSHKSQGSSYRRAFVDARDIGNYSNRGLYVAATRPKETLVI
jgi:exodeoxyribonuclease-5